MNITFMKTTWVPDVSYKRWHTSYGYKYFPSPRLHLGLDDKLLVQVLKLYRISNLSLKYLCHTKSQLLFATLLCWDDTEVPLPNVKKKMMNLITAGEKIVNFTTATNTRVVHIIFLILFTYLLYKPALRPVILWNT